VTVKEAAARLEVPVSSVYALAAAGRLPHRRIGLGKGVIRITEADLAEFLERCRVGGEERAEEPAPVARPISSTRGRGRAVIGRDHFA
jgi:excisionase family DNA binding protein